MKRILLLSTLFLSLYASAQTQGLPSGFILTSTGIVCVGTGQVCAATGLVPPGTQGNYVFNVTACDSTGSCSPSTPISLTVVGASVITITPTTLPNATTGKTYIQKLTPSGGVAPYTFSLK